MPGLRKSANGSRQTQSGARLLTDTQAQHWPLFPRCGLELDRDHNAAINILHRAVLRPGARKTRQWPVSAPGNLTNSARASRVSVMIAYGKSDPAVAQRYGQEWDRLWSKSEEMNPRY